MTRVRNLYKMEDIDKECRMKVLRFIAMLLMVIGSLNWGLVGFFQYDLVADLFGGVTAGFTRFIYALVGLAGLWGVKMLFCCGSCCHKGSCSSNKGK